MIDRFSIFHPNYIVNKSIWEGIRNSLDYIKGTLLDLGCGESPYMSLIKDKIDYYIGLNFYQDEIKDKIQSRINLIARGEKLSLRDNSVDTILCTEVLEHVPEPDFLMREMRRVLKPEGYLILSVPQVWYLHHRPYDYQRFTKFGLEYLFKRYEFEIIKIEMRGHFWLTIGQMFNYYIDYSFSSLPERHMTIAYFVHRIIRRIRKYVFAFNYYIFSFLDRLDKAKLDTVGYIAVAQKNCNI